jgi:hypothetical protein
MAARAAGLLAGALLLLVACAPRPAVEAPTPPQAPPAPPEEPLRLAHAEIGTVDKVLVDKSARRLYLLRTGAILAWAPVSLGRAPAGAKQRQGDRRTPEGDYLLDWRNPVSRFHRAIHISYPNDADLERAFTMPISSAPSRRASIPAARSSSTARRTRRCWAATGPTAASPSRTTTWT